MKNGRNWKSFAAGMLTMAMLIALGIPALAAGSSQTLQNVMVGGIRIVLDGQEVHPTDANGNTVEPMIYNGTTYLPVRAVASALGKAVYWDGPNFTVYLGDMNGQLEYPTVMLKDMTSVTNKFLTTSGLTDNYGNRYGSAIMTYASSSTTTFEYLLDMKYSHFKGTLYVPEGVTHSRSVVMTISADGRVLYTSPQMDATSRPVDIDVNVTGYNDFKIEFLQNGYSPNSFPIHLGDAGFYQ